MSSLLIRYEPDAYDEVGRLWFELQVDRFAGSGYFWSNLAEFPDIISKLANYPIGDAAKWAWGYDKAEGPDQVLGLGIQQVSPRGDLRGCLENRLKGLSV